MKDLDSMQLDDETYKDIIDKVGAEINEILKGMKNDKEMKKKFINDIYKDESDDIDEYGREIDEIYDAAHDSPIDEYYLKDFSEKSKRLPSSSDHSHSNIKNAYKEEQKDVYEADLIKDSSSSKNSTSKEFIGAHSFTAHELLGTGSFGEVYLVEKISDSTLHAMKVLCKDKIFEHKLARYAMTERNVLSVINHPFIVRLNYSFQTQNELFLILQYCPGGDLSEYLHVEK